MIARWPSPAGSEEYALAFDLTVPSVYLPWQAGATIVLAPSGDEVDASWAALHDESAPRLVRLTPGAQAAYTR